MLLSEFGDQLQIAVENKHYGDLSPLSLGFETCKPGKFFGPAIREYYLIHFIYKGNGVFENPRGCFPVSQGQAFLIRPGETCKYTADVKDPWVYGWLGFEGQLAKRFDSAPDVFTFEPRIVDQLLYAADMKSGTEEYLTGILFMLTSRLTAAEEKRNPIKQVTDFIDANFMHDIKVENIADMLHLNRKYLVRIFRRKTGLSIKEYLTDKRLREAKKFLSEGFGVSETAAMTGYGDSFNFSKAFKKKYGDPPMASLV